MSTMNNDALTDMSFDKSMEVNDTCHALDSTYYFSYTTGMDPLPDVNEDPHEMLPKEVDELIASAQGYDAEKLVSIYTG